MFLNFYIDLSYQFQGNLNLITHSDCLNSAMNTSQKQYFRTDE